MCYLNDYKPEERVDIDGRPLKHGDIVEWLEANECDDSWRYQGVLDRGDGLEIRDFSAFNIGYCNPGPSCNMRRVGNVFEDDFARKIMRKYKINFSWFEGG